MRKTVVSKYQAFSEVGDEQWKSNNLSPHLSGLCRAKRWAVAERIYLYVCILLCHMEMIVRLTL